jgi:hypothetical protein
VQAKQAAEAALYFPNMRVPETPWMNQILLYWDHVATLVPTEIRRDKEQLGQYMTALDEAGLLIMLPPDEILMFSPGGFNHAFMELLQSYQPPNDPEAWLWTPLHREKMNNVILSGMSERGLIRSPAGRKGSAGWMMAEKGLADLYVTFIAGSACRMIDQFYPVTDSDYAHNIMPAPDDMTSRLQEWRYAVIIRALPSPSRLVPPAEIAEFKDKYRVQLGRLRIYLNGQLAELTAIEDTDVLEARTAAALQQIEDEVAVLREQMMRRRWPRIVLAGVGGVAASALGVGAAIASGGHALALGLGIAGATAAAGPSAYDAAELLRSPRINVNSPLAYTVMADSL